MSEANRRQIKSTASRGLLQGARGRYFRAIDPRGNPPLSARDRGRHHWLPHGRRGQPLGQPVTVLRRPAGASITCRPPRPRRVPMRQPRSPRRSAACSAQPNLAPTSCTASLRALAALVRTPILPACSSSPRLRSPRSVPSTSSAASSRPRSSRAGVPSHHRHRAGPRRCPGHRRRKPLPVPLVTVRRPDCGLRHSFFFFFFF